MNIVKKILTPILKKEPVDLREFLTRVDPHIIESLFPNREEYIKTNDFRSLIREGIQNDPFRESPPKIEGHVYKRLKNDYLWIHVMNTYSSIGKFDEGLYVAKELIKKGASDSTTLNDYSALILTKLVKNQDIIPNSQEDIKLAKKMLYKAFIFDSKGKPREKIIDASLLPAYRNLILIRIIESYVYNFNENYFISYILAWISIEMSLTRMWCHTLSKLSLSSDDKKKMPIWDMEKIIDALYIKEGTITKKIRSEIHDHRNKRNKLIHGTLLEPTAGENKKILELSQQLLAIVDGLKKDTIWTKTANTF